MVWEYAEGTLGKVQACAVQSAGGICMHSHALKQRFSEKTLLQRMSGLKKGDSSRTVLNI